MPDSITTVLDRFRRELLADDAAVAERLRDAYGEAWTSILTHLNQLTAQIETARQAGAAVNLSWLAQQERLSSLLDQVALEVMRFAGIATSTVTQAQSAAVTAAQSHAEALVRLGLGTPPRGVSIAFNRLPRSAMQNLVGVMGDGSPLQDIFATFGPSAVESARRTLVAGVALGQSPRVMARQLQSSLGGDLVRAQAIARTETLRSYREASRETYLANSQVVGEWVWSASRTTRTCAFCWAEAGTVHPLEERMASHVNCRCVPVPRTKSWAELGFSGVPDSRPSIRKGEDEFAKLKPEQQIAVLGPGKFRLYQAGRLKLADLVGHHDDPRWGRVGYERSLQDVTA